MKIYKADLNTTIHYIIGLVILFAVIIPLSSEFSKSSLILLISFLLLFIAFSIFTYRLNEIKLDKVNSTLIFLYKNYIGIKRIQNFSLMQIEFTYKKQATSLYGGVKNVCTIYSSDKKIIQLVPGKDDWGDEKIKNFVYGLIELNVKKKFIGYSLKDAEI